MSSSLNALEELSLLTSIQSNSAAERLAMVERFKQVNAIAGAAMEAQERREHPPTAELDRIAPPLLHGSIIAGREQNEKVTKQKVKAIQEAARLNPLQLSPAQLLLASHPLHSALTPQKGKSVSKSSSSVSSQKRGHHRRDTTKSVSYVCDPDVVKGAARQFQTQLYCLLWGESVESDTEGVHPIVSSSKQAQDLFADLNVADVLLYGRTGTTLVPASSQSNYASAMSTARMRASSRAVSPGRGSNAQQEEEMVSVPVSPVQWLYMTKTSVTNEKKLCRKVDFDHRHVVPEFENRESETPLMGGAAGAAGAQQTNTGRRKALVKTCEIICERFRMDLSPEEEEEEAANQAMQAASSLGSSPSSSQPSSPRQHKRSPTTGKRTSPPTLFTQDQNSDDEDEPIAQLPRGARTGGVQSATGHVPTALENFHHRMALHGRTDPTQTKLDKLYFNKDDLRTFLRNPYGKGALLKFVISKSNNSELIRCTWVDKGLKDTEQTSHTLQHPAVKNLRRPPVPLHPTAGGSHSNVQSPLANQQSPFQQQQQQSNSSSKPGVSPYANHTIKFLVQTRTNTFNLNDAGFSFYERTLTYPHPHDHRTEINDLENEFNLSDIIGNVTKQAEYLRQRKINRDAEKRKLDEIKRKKKIIKQQQQQQFIHQQSPGGLNFSDTADHSSLTLNVDAFENEEANSAVSELAQDDTSTLLAQKNNQHYIIRNYEPGTQLFESLRAICDKLAAYFDLVLASGPAPGNKRRTRKMQLYFRRDASNQLWLLWSDCLEFEDPASTASPSDISSGPNSHAPPSPNTTKSYRNHLDPIPNHAALIDPLTGIVRERPATSGSSRAAVAGTGVAAMKISEEKTNEGRQGQHASDSDRSNDVSGSEAEGSDDERSGGVFEHLEEMAATSDEDDGRRKSWRAPRPKKPKTKQPQVTMELTGGKSLAGEAPVAKGEKDPETMAVFAAAAASHAHEHHHHPKADASAHANQAMCCHCRIVPLKHDLYFLQIHSLLHTYELESGSMGYFHQRKTEWSSLQWQEAPISLAETKESARRESISRNASRGSIIGGMDRRHSTSSPSPLLGPDGSPLSRPTSSARKHSVSQQHDSSGPSTPHTPHMRPPHFGTPPPASLGPAMLSPDPLATSSSRRPAGLPQATASATMLLPDVASLHTTRTLLFDDTPVPPFALFVDPTLTTEKWQEKRTDRAFLDQEVPVCGKCVSHVWMDPLLLREKFGQSINPIQHTIANQKSIGAADGTGVTSNNSLANFAWLKKRNMSPYDRAQAEMREFEAKHSLPSTAINFLHQNVSLARSGVFHVTSATRKAQRELSTGEGKDPYTCANAFENRWSHYSESKEDRDLSTSLQSRLVQAGALSAQIYEKTLRRRPEDMDSLYGLQFVEKDGLGSYAVVSNGSSTRANQFATERMLKKAGVPMLPKAATGRVGGRSNNGRSRSNSPIKNPYAYPLSQMYRELDAAAQREHDLQMQFGEGDLSDSAAKSSAGAAPTKPHDKDNTFLTSVDDGTGIDAELQLLEIEEGKAMPKVSPVETVPGLSLVSGEIDPAAQLAAAMKKSTPPVFGARMEERIAAKAALKAELEVKRREADKRSSEQQALSPSRFVYHANHEPSHPMNACIYDRPFSSPTRRPPNQPATIMDKSIRDRTWERVRQLQQERKDWDQEQSETRLIFKFPSDTPVSSFASTLPLPDSKAYKELDTPRRLEKAEQYRSVRRSPSVGLIRNTSTPDLQQQLDGEEIIDIQDGEDLMLEGAKTPPQATTAPKSSTPTSAAKRHRLNWSRSLGSLHSPETVKPPLAVESAASAYSSAKMPSVDTITPQQILHHFGKTPLMLQGKRRSMAEKPAEKKKSRKSAATAATSNDADANTVDATVVDDDDKGSGWETAGDQSPTSESSPPEKTPVRNVKSASFASPSRSASGSHNNKATPKSASKRDLSPASQVRLSKMQSVYRVNDEALKSCTPSFAKEKLQFLGRGGKAVPTSTLHVVSMPSTQTRIIPLTRAQQLAEAISPSKNHHQRTPSSPFKYDLTVVGGPVVAHEASTQLSANENQKSSTVDSSTSAMESDSANSKPTQSADSFGVVGAQRFADSTNSA